MDVPPRAEINAPRIQTGRYRHYKGDVMEVMGTALHSETLEPFVVYKHATGDRAGEGYFWVRPYEMFTGQVEMDGKQMPRFERLPS